MGRFRVMATAEDAAKIMDDEEAIEEAKVYAIESTTTRLSAAP